MRRNRARPRRPGITLVSVLGTTILGILVQAWVARGIDEDLRQQNAIEEFEMIGVSATTDAEPWDPDVPKWWSRKWRYATPWWDSRRWLAILSGSERPFGTVIELEFLDSISDAQWEHVCALFPSVREVTISCPVKDEELRFLI